jgi:hypothetical protein
MANYDFNPADPAVGTNLESLGRTRRNVVNADTWTIAEPTAGTKTLKFTKASSATARSAISMDAIDADTGRANIECLAVFRGRESTSNDCSIRVFARGSGAAATENCAYAGTTIGSSLNYIIGYFTAGTSTTIDANTLLSGQNYRNSDTWLAHRVRINGSDVYWRFWVPADPNDPTADEPATWSRDEISTQPISGDGWVGLIRNTHGNHEYLKLAFATNGDTASFEVTPDEDAPLLTTPTATATGATTASGSVTTNEGNGTLYYLVSTNATELVATVKAGSSQAVTLDGAQGVSLTGLTAETAYYLHFVHTDASANDSLVASSSQFTTAAEPAVPPTGSPTIGTITPTHDSASVAYIYGGGDATSYEYRIDGGTATAAGASPFSITGLTPETEYDIEMRALNANGAGSWSAVSTFTTDEAPIAASVTTSILVNNTGSPHANQAVHWTWLPAGRVGSLSSVTPQDGTATTDASGQLTVPDLVTPGILLVSIRNTNALDDDVYYEAFA